MRSIFAAGVSLLVPFLARVNARELHQDQSKGIEVLEYSSETAYTEFSIPCPGCFKADESSAAFVFKLQVNPTSDLSTSDVVLNGEKLDITWTRDLTRSSQILSLPDSSSPHHQFNLTWVGIVSTPPPPVFQVDDGATQNIRFQASLVESQSPASVDFVVIMRPNSPDRLVKIISQPKPQVVDFDTFNDVPAENEPWTGGTETDGKQLDSPDNGNMDSEDFDLAAEFQSLSLLEAQANELQSHISAKKKSISGHLKEERDKLCLKHLIKECDGIICTARVITRRICDKVGIPLEPSLTYAEIKNPDSPLMIAFGQKNEMDGHMMTNNHPNAAHIPLLMTKNGTRPALKAFDLVDPPNPLTRALQIIAAVLGLATIFSLIKRKCMSARTRAERAADREERRNERAYRRAARRALMRKRWDTFVSAVSCFRVQIDEPRVEDYEEKRALILQDAFLEQDLDQAEKGEVMEAEIRELRHAHEIVSSLVRVDEHRYEFVTPVHDPPPPMVRLPYTPVARSRASTGTLPSYTSESLPDYSSRPGDDGSSSRSVMHDLGPLTPSESLDEVGFLRGPPSSETSGRTRYTPTSSVLEMSPRASEETLRTRQSRDTQDR